MSLSAKPGLRLAVCFLMATAACANPTDPGPEPGSLSVATALGATDGDLAGFARAREPRELVFPADHGPHPEFKTEWWYWIGNLTTPEGRRFGFQLTFFRSSLAPPGPAVLESTAIAGSNWATRQLFMAHLALSDIDAQHERSSGGFRSFERFSRGAAGLAGAGADPFHVWLEDWSVESVPRGDADDWLLSARAGDLRLELVLSPGKNRVLHGDRGLSRKGNRPGAASYYYSHTHMPAEGRVEIGGTVHRVTGKSWFDHEWSTSLLAADEVGWDWLGAQLDDGRELMFFRLRKRDGSNGVADGTLVGSDGAARPLRMDGFALVPGDLWTSPATGISYPAGFRLELPAEELTFDVRPLLANQEIRQSFVYWEGAVGITGSVRGSGYLEMTGYGERASPR